MPVKRSKMSTLHEDGKEGGDEVGREETGN
jgi:hypothetical protein